MYNKKTKELELSTEIREVLKEASWRAGLPRNDERKYPFANAWMNYLLTGNKIELE